MTCGFADEKTVVPTGQQGEEASETLKCDVVIGSAIIYSPHHACVADLLQQAFFRFECHAAYIIQLSTRWEQEVASLRRSPSALSLHGGGLRYPRFSNNSEITVHDPESGCTELRLLASELCCPRRPLLCPLLRSFVRS